jgi:hypothetical protein
MTQAERSTLADRLASVKTYTNEVLYEAAKAGVLIQSREPHFILVSVNCRDEIIAALRERV